MKSLFRKITKGLITFFILAIFTTFFFTILLPPCFSTKEAYASSSISFAKKYSILTINKKVPYKVINIKKTDYVRFSVSDPSLAAIGKKTGWLMPKKSGKLTVKAIINNKKQQKLKTLTNHITIQEKKKILPNAVFKIKQSINPWNFTISLSCSRILLKKEISADRLTITPKGKKSPRLTASFTNLSADGKEIIYTLNASSQTKLCPGNSSMDGIYTLESLRFSKKLSLHYQERLTKNTLSGFVLNTNGHSVKNALVTLKKDAITIKKCYTDKYGHYQLQNASNADCLTVEKSGFQKNTIQNPTVSSKGTTCENIILRSNKETEVTIEFLITDNKETPISNTSIYIVEDKNTTPHKSLVSDDIENSSAIHDTIDSFSKEKILFSGKTDSSGRLLLSNSSSSSADSCSNFILGEQTLLSYSSETKFTNSIERTILPSSILNCNRNYAIYIKNFSPDNLQSSYNTKKILFSFSSLLTNHALLHVKLEKCQQTYLKNLSIVSDIPPSFCRSFMLQFFHPNQKDSFYQYPVEKEHLKISDNQITISSLLLPISLPEDTYYLRIQALSEENRILSQSDFTICKITKSEASFCPVLLQKTAHARLLVYGNLNNAFSSKAAFQLYQKFDGHYFYIGNYLTEPFTKTDTEFSTSSLYLNYLLPDSDYLLAPLSRHIAAKEYLFFHTTNQNIFPTKENAKHSLTPLARIQCAKTDFKTDSYNTRENLQHNDNNFLLCVPDDFYKSTVTIFYGNFCNITQQFIRSSQTYPNCVIAIYKSDGTLLASTLTTPPTDKINVDDSYQYLSYQNSHTPNNADSFKHSIIDISTNRSILITNQPSYQ